MRFWTLCVRSLSQPLYAQAIFGETGFGFHPCGLIPGDIGLQLLLLIAQVIQLIDQPLLNRTPRTLQVGCLALQIAQIGRAHV